MLRLPALAFCCSLVLLGIDTSPAAPREWKSKDGKFTVEADFSGFDGRVVKLKKANGAEISVPIEKLSDADQAFVKDLQKDNVAPLPPAVAKFEAAMESMRKVEAARIEERLDELKKQWRLGSSASNTPIAKEAKGLIDNLGRRLKLIKSGARFLPRLSPKDFAVGQIGEWDDDVIFSKTHINEDKSASIGVVFLEIRYREKLVPIPSVWHRSTVSRPDLFHLRADFAAKLPSEPQNTERDSPASRILRSHVYEVVEKKPRGMISDFILTPFKMDEVSNWLKEQGRPKKK